MYIKNNSAYNTVLFVLENMAQQQIINCVTSFYPKM